MGASGAVESVRGAVAELNRGNLDGYLAAFEPSCLRFVAGFEHPLTLTQVGRGFRDLDVAFEDLHLGEDQLFGDERFVCGRWRLQGRHVNEYLGCSPAGKTISVETCEVYEIVGGVVVTSWVYGDLLGQLVRQIRVERDEGA
jgi:SnoaL-like polyketide cyclase